ncbi:hypothetical protein FIBSPDRAFT_898358 [Athelia psychrophila]|uniref:Uncharacterized protein n=1 Tax=Athelia psychrophila TaxID=1759441 RepID=A0A166B4D4_9AGAM|nr:hypothetical protein FIBSPDRAFT_898358 [Fibularhizoctonia sp. CBS 109695]
MTGFGNLDVLCAQTPSHPYVPAVVVEAFVGDRFVRIACATFDSLGWMVRDCRRARHDSCLRVSGQLKTSVASNPFLNMSLPLLVPPLGRTTQSFSLNNPQKPTDPPHMRSASTSFAPVGVNPECGTLLAGSDHSLGNIANTIACALSMLFCTGLVALAGRRKAAVGRTELRIFLTFYTFTPLPAHHHRALPSTGRHPAGRTHRDPRGALLEPARERDRCDAGSRGPQCEQYHLVFFFAATTYIALDTGMHFTHVFRPASPLNELKSIPAFVLTSIWPAAATAIYFILIAYIVLGVLNEVRPMWFYVLSGVLFVLSQLDYFLLNKVICKAWRGQGATANAKIDGSFVATILETVAVGVLYLAWRSITEGLHLCLWNRGTTSTPYRMTISRGVEDLAFTQDRSPARGGTEKPTKKWRRK